MTKLDRESPPKYRSYLLRLWLEDAKSKTPWRIALINSRTGNRRGFADFEQLVEFLKEEPAGRGDSTSG